MEWLPVVLEFGGSVALGVMGWGLTSLYGEVRSMIDKHHELDRRIAVLEAMDERDHQDRPRPVRRDPR